MRVLGIISPRAIFLCNQIYYTPVRIVPSPRLRVFWCRLSARGRAGQVHGAAFWVLPGLPHASPVSAPSSIPRPALCLDARKTGRAVYSRTRAAVARRGELPVAMR